METTLRMLRDTPASVCLVADDDQTASGQKKINVFTGRAAAAGPRLRPRAGAVY